MYLIDTQTGAGSVGKGQGWSAGEQQEQGLAGPLRGGAGRNSEVGTRAQTPPSLLLLLSPPLTASTEAADGDMHRWMGMGNDKHKHRWVQATVSTHTDPRNDGHECGCEPQVGAGTNKSRQVGSRWAEMSMDGCRPRQSCTFPLLHPIPPCETHRHIN